jgi:hypothetical protein
VSCSKPGRAKNVFGDAALFVGIETNLMHIVQQQFYQRHNSNLPSHNSVRILIAYYRHDVRLA